MTNEEYKMLKDMQTEVMEAHLRDIIKIYIDSTEKGSEEENMPKYQRLLSDPVLMRKAAEVFDDEFWSDDDVINLEHQAAQAAINRVATEPAETEPENGFAIIRDGKKIYLTDDELKAIRRRDTEKHIRAELDDWLTSLLNSDDKEYEKIDRFLSDKKNIEALIAMLPDGFADCLYLEFDDRDWDGYYQIIDSLFRTRIRRMMGKKEEC